MEIEDARRRLIQLHDDLRVVIQRDPDEQVEGWAVPALDAVVEHAKSAFPSNEPVVGRLQHLMSPEAATDGAVMAKDLYLVIGQLLAALPPQQWSSSGISDPTRL